MSLSGFEYEQDEDEEDSSPSSNIHDGTSLESFLCEAEAALVHEGATRPHSDLIPGSNLP